MKSLTISALLLLLPTLAFTGKVLIWQSYGSKSHFIMFAPIIEELAKRGHELTVVAPYPGPKGVAEMDNVNYVIVETAHLMHTEKEDHSKLFKGQVSFETFNKVLEFNEVAMNITYHNPVVQNMLQNNPKFDVTIVDPFCMDLGVYMARHHINSSLMLFLTASQYPALNRYMGNPMGHSYNPNIFLTLDDENMNLVARLKNLAMNLLICAIQDNYMLPNAEKQMQRLLKLDEKPDLWGIFETSDFLLLNSHVAFEGVLPTNPNTATVGGIHLKEAKPLPDDLKKFLDGASEGAIYVSFGSVSDI